MCSRIFGGLCVVVGMAMLSATATARGGEVPAAESSPAASPMPSGGGATSSPDPRGSGAWVERFTLGGYGEMHVNFAEGKAPYLFDIHRLVLYLGYEFNDWITFHSEIEIEHAFVNKGSGGEVVLEQAYLEFLLFEQINVRFGRVLVPLGIINRKHEPPSFNGVERPLFNTHIIPTTWSADGVGIYGDLAPWLTYEAYLVAGLDGSMFTAITGIRNGRIKERPSFHEPAFTGRLDFFPFAEWDAPFGQTLRLGLSGYVGGLDNGNNGVNPGINGRIQIYSADFEYTIGRFDFRGAIAYEMIDAAAALQIGGGTATDIFGWYLEVGAHVWPKSWRRGKLREVDAVIFLRYSEFDTQYRMPPGVLKNPAGDRNAVTVGVNFYLAPNLVLKIDHQILDDGVSSPMHRTNLGVGWQF